MLSPEQATFFETFGFVVQRQSLKPAEVAILEREFEAAMTRDREGRPFPGERRQTVFSMFEQPSLDAFIDDDRIYEPLDQLIGPAPVWLSSTGHHYVGNTGWHSDAARFPLRRIKVGLYLDPVGMNTGCLRVIPGSHREPFFSVLKPLLQQRQDPSFRPFSVEQSEIPCYPMESEPGDLIFFDQRLWHASFGGHQGRRMMTLNVAASPMTEDDLRCLREMYQKDINNIQREQYTPTDRMFTDTFLHSERPRIKSLVRPWLELGLK